LLMSIIWTLAW